MPINLALLPNDPIKYRLVIDLDGVMIEELPIYREDREKFDFPKMLGNQGVLLQWKDQNWSDDIYYGFPDFDRLILTVLSWPGWGVDFFSGGVHERNVKVVSDYLTQKFSKYSENPQETYQRLSSSNQLRIYSRQHLKEGRHDIKQEDLEHYGRGKKDLTIVHEDISNVILADDDRSFILGDQYPYIGISWQATNDFISNLFGCSRELIFEATNNAAYIMGIVVACKELLDKSQASSLREALDITLSHNGKTLIPQYERNGRIENGCRNRNYTKWYLAPTHELSSAKDNGDKEAAYLTQMKEWIAKGRNCFDLFTQLAIFEENKESDKSPQKTARSPSPTLSKFQDEVQQKRTQPSAEPLRQTSRSPSPTLSTKFQDMVQQKRTQPSAER